MAQENYEAEPSSKIKKRDRGENENESNEEILEQMYPYIDSYLQCNEGGHRLGYKSLMILVIIRNVWIHLWTIT